MLCYEQTADLLLTNGDLFSGDRGRPRIRTAAIVVKHGATLADGRESEILSRFETGHTIDARSGIVHPRFIDTRLHLTSVLRHGLLATMDQDDVLVSALRCRERLLKRAMA